MGNLAAVILAAGKGTRMKSRKPKVLHSLVGRPLIHYPVQLVRALNADPIVVIVGHEGEKVKETLQGDDLRFVTQEPQLGTGHAVRFAKEVLRNHRGEILILYGDVPLLDVRTLRGLVAHHRTQGVPLTALVGRMADPRGYGRILRDGQGRVVRVVEERDATAEEGAIREVNAGTYCAQPKALFRALETIRKDNAQGEYYLTDVVEILAPEGVATFEASSSEEFMGINDRADLAAAEKIIQRRLRTP